METHAPDAPTDQDVLCPLCGYNLRGLPEARCPECGAQFDEWADLTDPARKKHPYLFEHHPRRNVRSFFSTLIHGCMPRRFWRTLHPAQTYRPRRLILYWALCVLLSLLAPLTYAGLKTTAVWRQMRRDRNWTIAWCTGPQCPLAEPGQPFASKAQLAIFLRNYRSVQEYVDDVAPEPTVRRVFAQPMFDTEIVRGSAVAKGNLLASFAFAIACALVVWPWVMTALLMLLRASMRQAAVRPIHLLRVTIYAADLIVWISLVGMVYVVIEITLHDAAASAFGGLNPAGWVSYIWIERAWNCLLFAPLVGMVILTYRFATAIRNYLHFRHALAVAICLQLILLLSLAKLLVIIA